LENIIEHYLPLIKELEEETGKQILKSLKNEKNDINLISKISEIKFGGLLLNEFRNFLEYEPKINNKTPDWLVKIESEKVIFEVLRINLPTDKMEKKISDYKNKIGIAPSGTFFSNGIYKDYGKIIAKEEKYRDLIENNKYKFIICIDASDFEKLIDNRDIRDFFNFGNPNYKFREFPKFINNVSGIIFKSYWTNDYQFIENTKAESKIPKLIINKIEKATLKGLNIIS